MTETTDYPFRDTVRFELQDRREVRFPLASQDPGLVLEPRGPVNGEATESATGPDRRPRSNWHSGDVVELQLPMKLTPNAGTKTASGFQRGPLVYALEIEERLEKSAAIIAKFIPAALGITPCWRTRCETQTKLQ